MTVEMFGLEGFERALPEGEYRYIGLVQDEHTFRVMVDPLVCITVRSSIGPDGVSAEAGKDSIRAWLTESHTGRPLGSKLQRWITRVSGWERRLARTIEELRRLRQVAGDCPVCGKPRKVWKVKKEGPNKGKTFAKCAAHGGFTWIDTEASKASEALKVDTVGAVGAARTVGKVNVKALKVDKPENKLLADRETGSSMPGGLSTFRGAGVEGRQGAAGDSRFTPADGGQGFSSSLPASPGVAEQAVEQVKAVEKMAEGVSLPSVPEGAGTDPTGNVTDTTPQAPSAPMGFLKGGRTEDMIDAIADMTADTAADMAADMTEDERDESPVITPTDEQLAAITAPVNGALRVLAGPGAGKTMVLSRRYAYLLDNGVRPENILAVTFSKDMAGELLERIIRVSPQVAGTAAERQISTIHAACYRMLRAEGDRRKLAKDWQIKKFLTQSPPGDKYGPSTVEELWPGKERPGWKEIAGWVNMAKTQGLRSTDSHLFYETTIGAFHGDNLYEVHARMDDWLKRERLLTFPDMLLDVETGLRDDSHFREKWQRRFTHILVDEAQDVSDQTMRILTMLAEPQNNLTAVGDADQLLYRFAGATPEANLYNGFESRYPDGQMVMLTVNFRSTRAIVGTQLELIRRNYDVEGGPYEQRYLKELRPRPDAPTGDPVTFVEYGSPGEEARAITASLTEAMANGRQPGDFFVGARTKAQLGYLEGELTRAKIPYVNITSQSFWTMKHVQDVVSYIVLAHDESNSAAFKRVFNIASQDFVHPWGRNRGKYCNHRYLGRAFLQACGGDYRNVDRAASQRGSFGPGVNDMMAFVSNLQWVLEEQGAPAAVQTVIEQCYTAYLQAEEGLVTTDESENGKVQDLYTVRDVAGQFDVTDGFLEYVRQAIRATEAVERKDWRKYVVISTVHRLKGLERPVVYGIGLSEGIAVGQGGVPLPAGLLPHTFSLRPPPQDGVLPSGEMGKIADERCIAFVLVSRAKEECHLSGVRTYRKAQMSPSRFVKEMGLQ